MKQLKTFEETFEVIKEELDFRYNDLEERSPNAERLERLQSELDKFEEMTDSLDSFKTELEELLEGEF